MLVLLPILLSQPRITPIIAADRPKRLVIVSWDAGGDWIVDRLLSEGKLPNVARMAQNGVCADHMTQAFPSKTAVGHYALFSGTWPSASGVVNNSVPLLPHSEHTILETISGFDAKAHLTEPLWVTFAKAGKRAVCLSAAGSFPPAPDVARLDALKVPRNRYVEFSGFEAGIESAKVVTDVATPFVFGGRKFSVRPFDDPNDPVSGFDSLEVTAESGSDGSPKFVLKPKAASRKDISSWSPPVAVQKGELKGQTYLRLYSLDPQGGQMSLYVRGASGMQGTQSAKETADYQAAYGGFHDDPFGPYIDGKLGKQIYAGGNGDAEERVLEATAFEMEFDKRSFRYGLSKYKPDVLWHYSPASDNAGHCWMGLMDPGSRAYRPDIADKLWGYLGEVFRMQDDWLGDMMQAAGPSTAFALVADHGMEGIDRYFNGNYALEKAGLLKRTADNKIDLTATQVCVPPWGDNQIIVNTQAWKGGIVPDSEKAKLLKQAEQALLNARDPETGEAVVTQIFYPDRSQDLGIGGINGGDLYFDLTESYYPSNRLESKLVTKATMPRAAGLHGFNPLRRKMQAIFYMVGPGVAKGVTIPGIRSIDVAPTLCRLMGVPLSPDNQGHVIGQALGNQK